MNSFDIGDPTDPVPPPSTAKLNKRRSFIRNFLPDDSSDSFSFQEYFSIIYFTSPYSSNDNEVYLDYF